jgi:hypothetical protein
MTGKLVKQVTDRPCTDFYGTHDEIVGGVFLRSHFVVGARHVLARFRELFLRTAQLRDVCA